jgi:hypothetical protein
MTKILPTAVLAACLAALAVLPLAAQAYEGHGRDPAEFSTGLSALRIGSVVPVLDDSGTGSYNAWCSSYLAPEGSKPKKTADMDEELRAWEQAVDEWSCMYSPQRAQDGNPSTAWCEGAADYGLGETLVVRVDATRPVRIWAGFGQSKDYFQKNARPHKVQLSILVAERSAANQRGTTYLNLKVLAQAEAELKDINGWQTLPLPPARLGANDGGLCFVAIKILSVYPGSKYKDTLISEIGNTD